jgi:hypothetical protein
MTVRRRARLLCSSTGALAATGVLFAALAGATPPPAQAAAGTAHWKLETRAAPTNLPLAHDGKPGEGVIVATLANLGSAPANGARETVTAVEKLPAGVQVTSFAAASRGTSRSKENVVGATGFKCAESEPRTIRCTFERELPVYEELEIFMRVDVTSEQPSEPDSQLTVAGGEAGAETLTRPLELNDKPTVFGLEEYGLASEEADGAPDVQAGTHPYQMTTTFNLDETLSPDTFSGTSTLEPSAPALAKNLYFKLPPGLIGNPNVGKQCTAIDFAASGEENINACGAETVVGVATVTVNDPILLEYTVVTVPVFNLVPGHGEPAQLGFEVEHVPVILNTFVRTGGDYGVTVDVKNAPEAVQLLSSRVTIWGVPGEASHDPSRGWGCLGYKAAPPCEADTAPVEPFLTLPTECNARPTTSVSGESWPLADGAAAEIPQQTVYAFPEALTGCELLDFSPTIEVKPESPDANTPTGLTVHIHVPQQSTLEANGRAEAAVRDTTVELPEGVLLSPSAANGLEACAEQEDEGHGGVGFTGFEELDKEGEPGIDTATFTERLPNPLEPGRNFCPSGSKVGVVHITSPDLLRRPLANGTLSTPELVGGVYLAMQNANPFGSLFAMYIVAEEPESGVLVKAAGEVQVNPQTGRITSTFENTPDVPYEDLTLELFGGPRASLTTPPVCGGPYVTSASFTPWSSTKEHPLTATSNSAFAVQAGAGGTECKDPQPFAPSFAAGSSDTRAGAYTPFEVTLGHADTDQAPSSLSVLTPPGLAAIISHVTLCQEPQAAEGTCGPESLIGEATATVGLGSEPFTQTGGQVFITGPYQGAPFGLSVVVPTKAGPFDFGNVVTRATIEVDPNTAAVTIDSPLPTMVNTASHHTGIPVQLEQIHVVVNRPEFEFNPTDCGPLSVQGTLTGAQGATASVSSPFQATDCASLPFAPKLTASVAGQGSKVDGTTFAVKIESPGLGQANIHKLDLTIPSKLPSRLTTIQKACVDTVFDTNPADCDEGSVIGEAVVHTPVFKNPLRGPAYLVSHGGAAFPDVELVLQGENVTIVLDGKTDIKHGVTYSRFETSPDAPFTTVETIFPAGPHSALTPDVPEADDYNLCATSLTLPTEITAQDGASISQDTKVAITGCHGVLDFKQTTAERLAKALKLCRSERHRRRRLACERTARRRYATRAKRRASSSGPR